MSSRHRGPSVAVVGVLLGSMAVGCKPAADPLQAQGPATATEAQQFVVALVNRDREQEGLAPVEWDPEAALAAQRHAEDMARHGFTGHWGTDGSVPEQRYTEAGGMHFVQENAACFFDGETRELEPSPVFDRAALEKIEIAFISEVPPHDGHRKNILKPHHNRLGVGLAKPVGVNQPCMAQEFVDRYGSLGPLPAEAGLGDTIRVEGEVEDPVTFGGVGLARIDPAAPIPVAELGQRSTYQIPEPHVVYFPEGFKTPKPVQVDGNRFSIEIPLDVQGKSGRYEVSVWGKYPGSDDLVMVSLRTIIVR